ncbi:MAG: alpha/beta hydrolase [Candidatus Nanopelagicales bacterium]
MTSRKWMALVLAPDAAVGLLAASPPVAALSRADTASAPAVVTAREAGDSLDWRPCGSRARPRECATVPVPIDYSDPSGPLIDIAVARIPARDPARRRGAIVIEPGGPGISGVNEILQYDSYLTDRVEKYYDVVGFDPRGVGSSSPVWCRTTKQMDRYANALAAVQWDVQATGRSVDRWRRQAQRFGVGCHRNQPDLVAHLGTIDAARDLDRIRAALGQSRLDYVGWSYGTKLGAVYADRFPDRVGHLVLDSAINPALTITRFNRGQSRGMERALWRFFRWCAAGRACPLPTGRSAATAVLRSFLTDLPSRRTTPRTVTRADAMSALSATMYHPDSQFPVLKRALRRAMQGNGRALIRLGGRYGDQDPDRPSNFLNALYAINCFDSPPTAGATTTARRARRWDAKAPIFGAPAAWGILRCHTFPAHTPEPTGPVSAPGAAPILIIGARRDAATPVRWSRQLARQLTTSHLVVADTGIHSVYPGVNRCVRRVVDRYLLRDRLPAKRSHCAAD